MSLEINPGSERPFLVGNEELPRQSRNALSVDPEGIPSESTSSFPSNHTTRTTTFDQQVLDTWSFGLPTDDFIRELLSENLDNEELGPAVDPRDLMPIASPKKEKEETAVITLSDIQGLTPVDSSQIPTILLEEDDEAEEIQKMVLINPPKPRGRPKGSKMNKVQEKRPRGRPLGSANKNRVIPIPQSENEAKYFRTRELNNAASRRCRIHRKKKLQVMLMEEVRLREKNTKLKEQVRVKGELIERLKSQLISLASSSIVPMVIPINQINS